MKTYFGVGLTRVVEGMQNSREGDMIRGRFRFPAGGAYGSMGVLLIVLVLVCCWGCTHPSPKTHPAEPPALQPGTWNESMSLQAQAPPVESGTLTLERAVEETIKASPELVQMQQRIEAASEQIKQVEASFYPRIILSEEYNVTDNPVFALMHIINQRRLQPTVNFNDPGQQQNFATRVRGEWSVFEGGSAWHDRKAAVSQRGSIQAELMAARNRLVSKVTEVYYQWLQALSFIGVAGETLEAARTDERLGEARQRVEMALPSDIARLKARAAEVHGNLVTAKSNARRLQAALERLVARSIRPEEVPDPSLFSASPSPPPSTEDPESLVRQALEKRPEIAAVQAMIRASFERVKSAQGGFLPRLGASAQVEWDSESLSDSADSWMVGIHASLPLFEGGLTLARLRESRARLKEMEARGEQVALDIALEVRQAALTVQEASEKIKVQDERRRWAQKAMEEVRHQYRNEVAGVDSLLQAQVAWNQAEVAYTSAVFEGRIAEALLRQSLGDFADGIL